MYKNYIFDLYGTLIDIRTDENEETFWESFAEYLGTFGLNYTGDEVHKIYDQEVARLLNEPSKYDYPEIDIMRVFQVICNEGGTADMPWDEVWKVGEKFRQLSTHMLKLYDNTLPVLKALKAAGKKIYLLSNAQSVFTRQELAKTGIEQYFDDIFISSDAGCKKPDKKFYERLISKHSLNIRESIMIGNDGSSDIAGAEAVGMDALYIRTEISPAGEPLPDCLYAFEDGDIGHVIDIIK